VSASLTGEQRKLVDDWIELYRAERSTSEHDPLFGAFVELDALVSADPDTAWRIILEILKRDEKHRNMRLLGNLAAGPLEDLLVRHGENAIKRVEQESMRDPEFRFLLGGVWQNRMSDAIWSRVQAAAGAW
jgi:hypothetical protein